MRPVTLMPGSDAPLRALLQVETGPFSETELRRAIQKMQSGKATKKGDIPTEFFKAIASETGGHLHWMLELCNHCWTFKEVPLEWSQTAAVPADWRSPRPVRSESPVSSLHIRYGSRVLFGPSWGQFARRLVSNTARLAVPLVRESLEAETAVRSHTSDGAPIHAAARRAPPKIAPPLVAALRH